MNLVQFAISALDDEDTSQTGVVIHRLAGRELSASRTAPRWLDRIDGHVAAVFISKSERNGKTIRTGWIGVHSR